MSENIKDLNKQITSFVLLSVALAVPVSSSSAVNTENMPQKAVTQDSAKLVLNYYGAPEIPNVQGNGSAEVQDNAPAIVFYGAPEYYRKQIEEEEEKIKARHKEPVMLLYAAPYIIEPPIDQNNGESQNSQEKKKTLWERMKSFFKK